MKKYFHKFAMSVTKNDHQIINCLDCGYWHIHPMPSAGELDAFYRQKYYSAQTLISNRTMTDKERDPDGFYGIQYQDRLRRVESCLKSNVERSVLDIGAGYGDFLAFMAKNGWKTEGIEPSAEVMSDRSRTLGIRNIGVDGLGDTRLGKYSLVTVNNVLEHIQEPAVLRGCGRSLLSPSDRHRLWPDVHPGNGLLRGHDGPGSAHRHRGRPLGQEDISLPGFVFPRGGIPGLRRIPFFSHPSPGGDCLRARHDPGQRRGQGPAL